MTSRFGTLKKKQDPRENYLLSLFYWVCVEKHFLLSVHTLTRALECLRIHGGFLEIDYSKNSK